MRSWVAIFLLAFVASACQPPSSSMGATPPQAMQRWDDWFIAATGWPLPWRQYPCAKVRKEEFRGTVFEVVESMPTDECVYMTPPRRWRGLWLNEFEGSQFCQGRVRKCDYGMRPRIWLSNGPNERQGGLYEVEFEGRRTQFLGDYGHFGMFDHEIIVDRMISIRRLPETTQN